MSESEHAKSAMTRLAARLDAQRAEILEGWREAVAADGSLDIGSEWTLKQVHDHFPDVLESLGRALRAWPEVPPSLLDSEQDFAVAHARARWVQGYSLRGVIREWGHFNAILVGWIATDPTAADDPATLRHALAVWSRILNDQQTQSALEYHRLEQAEAQTRGEELARVLEVLRTGSQVRGRAIESLASSMRNDLQVMLTSNAMDGGTAGWHEAYQLRELSRESFHSLEEALSNMVALAQLEAGRERRRLEPFDAGEGLVLLVEGLQHVAAQRDATLRASGPAQLRVEGDAERVRRLATHLLLCALRAPASSPVTLRWGPSPASPSGWRIEVEHAVDATQGGGSEAGRALAHATDAAQQVAGVAPTGEEGRLSAGAIPIAAGDGVDLLIAKHLCELLDGGLEVEAERDLLRYRVTLPTTYAKS